MPRRSASSLVSNLSSLTATPDTACDTASATATERQPSTPATSQSGDSITPADTNEAKENEIREEITRLRRSRVTRSSVGTGDVDTAETVKNDDAAAGIEQAGIDASDRTRDDAGSGSTMAGRRMLRARRSTTGPNTTTVDNDASSTRRKADAEKRAAAKSVVSSDSAPTVQAVQAEKPSRRSSRLSLLDQAKDIMKQTTNVLGKRSRGQKTEKARPDRRASLRPRDVNIPVVPKAAAKVEEPPTKKQRRSEAGIPAPKAATSKAVEDDKPKRVPHKRKRWLSHGLYAGQHAFDPNPAPLRGDRRQSTAANGRAYLPLPMYSGAKVLENGRDFKLPFDIFSPLPPGQPKPDEWRKTNKNVFVGDAASIWKATKLTEVSTCMCTPASGCDENCQNRYMFYECDDANCKLGEALCGNRSFSGLRQRCKAGGKFNIGVEVIKTADRGYGVRSNRCFAPNQIIVEYTGEIITQEECERRMRTIYKDNECYYLMYFDQNMIIDATRGSIARFVNHSCEPNCRMEKWTVSGKPRMALFAGESGIMTGEELTYDYNFDPYSLKNAQECRCGTPSCRGILGPRTKDVREKKAPEPKLKKKRRARASTTSTSNPQPAGGRKRKVDAILDESTSLLNKKRKLLKPTAASLKAGLKKAITKAVRATKKAVTSATTTSRRKATATAKAKTTVTTTSKPTRTNRPARQQSQQQQQQKSPPKKTNPAQGTKRPARTIAGGLMSRSKPKMTKPKPRVSNSIAAARKADNTPNTMKAFLEQGKKLHEQSRQVKDVEAKKVGMSTRQVKDVEAKKVGMRTRQSRSRGRG